MANKPIWPGSCSFSPGSGSTPFGFYDYDADFASDAPKVADFSARKLGYPIMDVELQDINFFAAFEQAVTTYGNELYLFQIRDNYLGLQGTPTSSALNNTVISPSIQGVIRMSEAYGEAVGVGGSVTWYTGSLDLIPYQQNYDMKAWASESGVVAPGDSILIRRVFYESPPAIMRYFDPYAGSGYQGFMDNFGWGSYSPAITYMMFPVFWDIQKIQAIEMSDTVRRSAFSFELINNNLKIFPVPATNDFARQGKLWFEYSKNSEINDPFKGPYSGSVDRVTNIGNVPYNNPTYSEINAPGRYWIFEYASALAKEMLGYIRGKYQVVPIPGDETTLNHGDLLADARSERTALIEKLRNDLESATRQAQLERKQAETEATKTTLAEIPLMIYIG